MSGQRFVEVVHVGLVVPVVMDFHRLGVDVRLEGAVIVGKRGQLEPALFLLLLVLGPRGQRGQGQHGDAGAG